NAKKVLTRYAQALGAEHLVQGHQYGKVRFVDNVQRADEEFFQRWGLLFLIDTGMSRGIENTTSVGGVLHINAAGDRAEIICDGGETRTIWNKGKNQDHKAQHCGEKQ